jgi:hypothetical protein
VFLTRPRPFALCLLQRAGPPDTIAIARVYVGLVSELEQVQMTLPPVSLGAGDI